MPSFVATTLKFQRNFVAIFNGGLKSVTRPQNISSFLPKGCLKRVTVGATFNCTCLFAFLLLYHSNY